MTPLSSASAADFQPYNFDRTGAQNTAVTNPQAGQTYVYEGTTGDDWSDNTNGVVSLHFDDSNTEKTLTDNTLVLFAKPVEPTYNNPNVGVPNSYRWGLNLLDARGHSSFSLISENLKIYMGGYEEPVSLESVDAETAHYHHGILLNREEAATNPDILSERSNRFTFNSTTLIQYEGPNNYTGTPEHDTALNTHFEGVTFKNGFNKQTDTFTFEDLTIIGRGNVGVMHGILLNSYLGQLNFSATTADIDLRASHPGSQVIGFLPSGASVDSKTQQINFTNSFQFTGEAGLRAFGMDISAPVQASFGPTELTVTSRGDSNNAAAYGIYLRTARTANLTFNNDLAITTTVNNQVNRPQNAVGIYADTSIGWASQRKLIVKGNTALTINAHSGIGIFGGVAYNLDGWTFEKPVAITFGNPNNVTTSSPQQRVGVMMSSEGSNSSIVDATWEFKEGLITDHATQSIVNWSTRYAKQVLTFNGLTIRNSASGNNFAHVVAYTNYSPEGNEDYRYATINIDGVVDANLDAGETLFLAANNSQINVTAKNGSVFSGNAYARGWGTLNLTLQGNAQAKLFLHNDDSTAFQSVSPSGLLARNINSYGGGDIHVTLKDSAKLTALENQVSQVSSAKLLGANALLDLTPATATAFTTAENSALLAFKTATLTGATSGAGSTIQLHINSAKNVSQYVDAGNITGNVRLRVVDTAESEPTLANLKKLVLLKGDVEADANPTVSLVEISHGAFTSYPTLTLQKTTALTAGEFNYVDPDTTPAPDNYSRIAVNEVLNSGPTRTYWFLGTPSSSEDIDCAMNPHAEACLEPEVPDCTSNPTAPGCQQPDPCEADPQEPGCENNPNPEPNPCDSNPQAPGCTPPPDPNPDPNPNPDPVRPPVRPTINNEAWGSFGLSTLAYAMATEDETLRERMGDVQTFVPLGKTNLWAKASRADNRLSTSPNYGNTLVAGVGTFDVNISHVKAGFDRRVSDATLVGGWLGYSWSNSFDAPESPASLKAHAAEVALYAIHRFENEAYVDAVARVGRVDGRFSATDGDSLRDFDTDYGGVGLEVGRRFALTDRFSVTPEARFRVTRFGAASGSTDSGLFVRRRGFTSVIASAGASFDWRPMGDETTLYAHARYVRELNAEPDFTFNRQQAFTDNYEEARVIYGLGAMGRAGKETTWHFTLNRTASSLIKSHWNLQAGLRIGF